MVDYLIDKNIFLSMMKKELFLSNLENVQISFEVDKEKLDMLDTTIDGLNKKLNYEINYCRVDIIRIAIKLYIHFLKEYN